MSFPSALTTQQKADIRANDYAATVYALATPQDIVFQATVKDAINGQDYASIEFDTPTTGAYTDIKAGMTVIVHSDSSDIDTVRFPPTYARDAATATEVLIGWQATDLLGTDTITVLNDYRLHVRQVRQADGVVLRDYDNQYTPLPPRISGLQSVYVYDQSTAASIDFAPTVEAMASGASIFSYLWDVGDGTITTGTSTDKDITVSFPAYSSGATDGWRWVSLTTTDSNDVVTVFNFQVFVGNLDNAAWSISDIFSVALSNDISDGYVGSLPIGASAASLYKDNHITLVIRENKNGDTDAIVSNILFVGRAKQLTDAVTASLISDVTGVQFDKDTTYEIQGYGSELSQLPLPPFPLNNSSNASKWSEVTNITISRAIWYTLAFMTTAPTVMSFDLQTSIYNNYQNTGFSFDQGTVLDAVNRVGDLVGVRLVFSRSGEALLSKDGRLLSASDRNALTTVLDITTDDLLEVVSLTVPSKPSIGRLVGVGGHYDTTLTTNTEYEKLTVIRVQAPKIPNTLGETENERDVLLQSDQTSANQLAEIAEFVANDLALRNEKERLSVRLLAGYWFLIAHNAQWYTFTYSSWQSGVSYDTNTRWVLVDTTFSPRVNYDPETQSITQEWGVDCTFEIETSDEGIANSVTYAPNVQPYDVPQNPTKAPYGSTYDPNNAYADDISFQGNADTGSGSSPQPASPNNASPVPTPSNDSLSVPFTGETVTSNKTTISGNTYKVTVNGIGTIDTVNVDTVTFEDGGYSDYAINQGTIIGKALQSFVPNPSTADPTVQVTIDLGADVAISGVAWDYFAEHGNIFVADPKYTVRYLDSGLNEVYNSGIQDAAITEGSFQPVSDAGSGTGRYVELTCTFASQSSNSKRLAIDNIDVTAISGNVLADAFYTRADGVALGASAGLQLDGSNIATSSVNPSSMSASGQYVFTVAGTNSTLSFNFLEQSGDYSDNNGAISVLIEGVF